MRKTPIIKAEERDVIQKARQVPVYLPIDLDRRLSRFQFEKFDGKQHLRAAIIRHAIDRYLTAEGY
jgi:hypothetical protein